MLQLCSQSNTFQGILITNGNDSYAVFTYECGTLQWAQSSTVIGFKAQSYFRNYPTAGEDAMFVACVDNAPGTNWRNLVYKLSSGGSVVIAFVCTYSKGNVWLCGK